MEKLAITTLIKLSEFIITIMVKLELCAAL